MKYRAKELKDMINRGKLQGVHDVDLLKEASNADLVFAKYEMYYKEVDFDEQLLAKIHDEMVRRFFRYFGQNIPLYDTRNDIDDAEKKRQL